MACLVLVTVALPPAGKVLAVAAVVYVLMQSLKKVPQVSDRLKGWWAVALNVGLTVLGIVVATPASQLYTPQTLQAVAAAVLASAGIHGTVSKVILPPKGQESPQSAQNAT